jgi:hypothetical protein
MIAFIKRNFLPALIAISALSISASAAFYSVSGLSKLFAGASFAVMIMAASLEASKLVIASLLYQYWKTLNKLLRAYLTVAAVVLVLITSMGIYGFLSAAYQDTYRQLSIKNNKVAFLEQKRDFYEKDVARYDEEIERISNNISTLSGAKATSIQVRDTTSSTGFRSTISTTELRMAQKRIDVEEKNRAVTQAKREIVADSLQKYQLAILELENESDVAGELGPLEYLSGLTGVPMDKIINILLLTIVFVFDPLAISLVIAANFAFEQAKPKRNLYQEVVDDFDNTLYDGLDEEPWEEDPDPFDTPPVESEPAVVEDPTNIEVTYEEVKPNKAPKEVAPKQETKEDWKVVDEQGKELKDKPIPKKILQKGPSQHRVLFSDGSQRKVSKDSDIIRYL